MRPAMAGCSSAPAIIIVGVFLDPADLPRGVGQLQRLERPGLATERANSVSSAPKTMPRCSSESKVSRSATSELRSATTCTTCSSVVPLQTALALFLAVQVNRAVLRGRRLLPHRVLLSLGHELDRHHNDVPFPLHRVPEPSTPSLVGSAINGPNWFSDPSGVIHNALLGSWGFIRHPKHSTGSVRSVSPGGNGSRDHPSPCACSSSSRCSPLQAPSCCSSWRRLQNIGAEIDEASLMDGAGPSASSSPSRSRCSSQRSSRCSLSVSSALAGLRPDLSHWQGRPEQDAAHSRVPRLRYLVRPIFSGAKARPSRSSSSPSLCPSRSCSAGS